MLGWGIGPFTMVKCHSHREQTGRNSQAWFPNPGLRSQHPKSTHILAVFQEDREVVILPQGGMGCQALQEDFMHCNRLLKDGQVLPVDNHSELPLSWFPLVLSRPGARGQALWTSVIVKEETLELWGEAGVWTLTLLAPASSWQTLPG